MNPIVVLLSEPLCTTGITQIDPARTLFPIGDLKKKSGNRRWRWGGIFSKQRAPAVGITDAKVTSGGEGL